MSKDGLVVVGRIAGVYGVRGWVKIISHTDPIDNIFEYSPWQVMVKGQWREWLADDGRAHGKGIIAHLQGLDDREQARELTGSDIAIRRSQLPPPAPGEYYWADLVGLAVITVDGVGLGTVDHLLETGANDVLVVKGDRERLIPYLPDAVVKDIDLALGVIRVDWSPEF